MPKTTSRQYWKMILGEARRKASSKLGFSFRIISVIVSALGGAITTLAKGGNMQETFLFAALGAAIGFLLWFVVWFVFFSSYVISEPVVRNNEQQETIDNAQPSDPLEFIILPPSHVDPNAIRVGIDIVNHSWYELTCYPTVLLPQKIRSEDLVSLDMGLRTETDIKIQRKSSKAFYFAIARKEDPNAIINTLRDDSRQIQVGEHHFEIIIGGQDSTGRPVEHSELFVLIYKGEDRLELKPGNLAKEQNE